MLIHKKSKAVFEDTFTGEHLVLKGINIKGTFRVPILFESQFTEVDIDNIPDKADMVAWRRFLIYTIGKTREVQKAEAAAKVEAMKRTRVEKEDIIEEGIEMKGNTVKNLNLEWSFEEYEMGKILREGMTFEESVKIVEEYFNSQGREYGQVSSYGNGEPSLAGRMLGDPNFLYYVFPQVKIKVKLLFPRNKPRVTEPEKVEKLKKEKLKQGSKLREAKPENKNDKLYSKKPSTLPEGLLGIPDLEKELGLPATKIRAKLRKSGVIKPSIGWKWNKEEYNEILKIFK